MEDNFAERCSVGCIAVGYIAARRIAIGRIVAARIAIGRIVAARTAVGRIAIGRIVAARTAVGRIAVVRIVAAGRTLALAEALAGCSVADRSSCGNRKAMATR